MAEWKQRVKDMLFDVLCLLRPTERPSETELIAYGKEMERRQHMKASVWIDPAVKPCAYPQVAAYEPPQRTTEKVQVPSNPHGAYFLREHKRYTRLVDTETQGLNAITEARMQELLRKVEP